MKVVITSQKLQKSDKKFDQDDGKNERIWTGTRETDIQPNFAKTEYRLQIQIFK